MNKHILALAIFFLLAPSAAASHDGTLIGAGMHTTEIPEPIAFFTRPQCEHNYRDIPDPNYELEDADDGFLDESSWNDEGCYAADGQDFIDWADTLAANLQEERADRALLIAIGSGPWGRSLWADLDYNQDGQSDIVQNFVISLESDDEGDGYTVYVRDTTSGHCVFCPKDDLIVHHIEL